MDSQRKRQRLGTTQMDLLTEDAIMINTNHSDDGSIDLASALPANLYFTICDELSNNSQDFLSINTSNLTTQIKQEPKLEIEQSPLQYRLVRSGVTIKPNSTTTSLAPTTTNLLPTGTTAVQLPSGCEIYLVKEYVDSDCSDILISEDCEELETINRLPQSVALNHSATQTSTKSLASVSIIPKVIKTELGSQNQIQKVNTPKVEKATIKTTGPTISNYKKRDEKRRATHNEVERRRRDKINSWIFKLKEMLPTDAPNVGSPASKSKVSNSKNICSSLPATAQFETVEQVQLQQQQQPTQMQRNNSRSPPSDSKSQILIKACEYIKQMQDEVKSLRECLMENEKLRTNNQRLQNELNRLKLNERRRLLLEQQQQQLQQQQQCSIDNTNIIDTGEDFTLALCAGPGNLDDTSTLFASSPTSSTTTSIALISGSRKTALSVPYTKRELIISDYVD